LVVLVAAYFGATFLGFNLPKPAFLTDSISGSAVLEVRLLMDNNVQDPVARVEVDLAEEPGPPPDGGVATTDQTGTATFNVKPGEYVIYFNDSNFPENLSAPATQPVTVTQEGPNVVTIMLSTAD
jgi:hypothetical protein